MVLTFVLATLVIGAASVLAQAGSSTPCGGTGLRRTVEETCGPVARSDGFDRGFSVDLGLSRWLAGFAAHPFFGATAPRPVAGARLRAVVQRRVWIP